MPNVLSLPSDAFPLPRKKRIIPCFIPFRGCPVRCLFCAQDTVTGTDPGKTLQFLLTSLQKRLCAEKALSLPPCELAFYGGTFTALSEGEFSACLEFAQKSLQEGLIHSFRCSTRPDSLSEDRLERLHAAGCTTIELGIQTFYDDSLSLTRRGYTVAMAECGAIHVKKAGFNLGVQLLPGMPGSTPMRFLTDVKRALALGADFFRFYPCLVFAGTGLAELFAQGIYSPWTLEETVRTLAEGYLLTMKAGVPVIRMGLLIPSEEERRVLAGPFHPALGSRVMGRALFLFVQTIVQAQGRRLHSLHLPNAMQGFFWGHRREMAQFWAELGIEKNDVSFHSDPSMTLVFSD